MMERVRPGSAPFAEEYFDGVLANGEVIQSGSDRFSVAETLAVKWESKEKGKGLYALRKIPAGSIIFKEKPLIALQDTPNKAQVEACAYCLRFVGSLEGQLALITAETSRPYSPEQALPFQERCMGSKEPLPSSLPCSEGGVERYCSVSCRERALASHQKLLSWRTSRPVPGHPLYAFDTHAIESGCDAFRLAAAIIAKTVLEAERNGGDVSKAWYPFGQFVRAPWWEVKPSPEEDDDEPKTTEEEKERRQRWKAELKRDLGQSLALLRHAFQPFSEKYPQLFTEEFYSDIMGMLELNSLYLQIRSPLERYFGNLERRLTPEEYESVREELSSVLAAVNEQLESSACIDCDHDHDHHHEGEDEEEEDEEDEEKEGKQKGKEKDKEKEEDEEDEDEENEFEFPACCGTGLYAVQSCLNHSCQPNVQVFGFNENSNDKKKKSSENEEDEAQNRQEDSTLICWALRDIEAGEELLMSYIDERADKEERQRALLYPYSFRCACPKCA
ncbi:hypothetical protein QOT17_001078 [Balamuthia mandrillaris]